jgi:hypothetical protein
MRISTISYSIKVWKLLNGCLLQKKYTYLTRAARKLKKCRIPISFSAFKAKYFVEDYYSKVSSSDTTNVGEDNYDEQEEVAKYFNGAVEVQIVPNAVSLFVSGKYFFEGTCKCVISNSVVPT